MASPIRVWKEKPGRPYQKMWKGCCRRCGHTAQYWNWGAALGHMLHHHWKTHSEESWIDGLVKLEP